MAGGHTPSVNPIKRLYNGGSEWQDDIDGLADYYSTFFREYDAVIGRFNGVDPVAEVDDELSSYAYSGNNPIMMNDPLGDFKFSNSFTIEDIVFRLSMSKTGGTYSKKWGFDFNSTNFFVNDNNEGGGGKDGGWPRGRGESGTGKRMFIFPVLESLTPNIYNHILFAITKLGKPFLLTYDSDKANNKNRRKQATKGCVAKRPFSCDEYPFASTMEGGFYNGSLASTRVVPEEEQSLQGWMISRLTIDFGMKTGDKIFVVPVSKENQLRYSPSPQHEFKMESWYDTIELILEKLLQRFVPIIPMPYSLPEPNGPIFQPDAIRL